MAFISAGDTDKLFLACVTITLFLYWRNWESVRKLGAIRKKTRRFLFQIEKGNKSGVQMLVCVGFSNSQAASQT